MDRTERLRVAALVGCLAMAGLLGVYQFVPGFGHPPIELFLVFTGVWLFGAAMLWMAPLFGGAGTAAYGLLLGAQLLATHDATRAQNLVLAVGSFAVAALAIAFLVLRWQRRAKA